MMSFINYQQILLVVRLPNALITISTGDGLSHQNDNPAIDSRGRFVMVPFELICSRDARTIQLPTGLVGQSLAMGQPDRLSAAHNPSGQQR